MRDKNYIPDIRQTRLRDRLQKLDRGFGGELTDESRDRVAGYSQRTGSMNIGELTEFDPYDQAGYPRVAGIYVLYDICERPLYVGQGMSIDKRLRNHVDKFWFKSPIVESASYVRIDDKSLRERVEAVLIKFLKGNAVINKRLVDR